MIGATVITTAGNDDKVEKARALGAHHGASDKTRDSYTRSDEVAAVAPRPARCPWAHACRSPPLIR
jgi:hypothetical protein